MAKLGKIVKRGLDQAWQIGEALNAAKALCEVEGTSFMVFVRENCQISHRSATNYLLELRPGGRTSPVQHQQVRGDGLWQD